MLRIYRSSRIERLATLLWTQLAQTQPQNVLAAQTVVIGHLGMKRWLVEWLASTPTRAGDPGIAANLDMLRPGGWLDGLAQQVLGVDAIALEAYRRPALCWRIYRDLPLLEAPEVQRYLTGSNAERRRYQLADRLAGLYVQYLVYRRDWLSAWEKADAARPGLLGHWQGELWRRLTAGIGAPHRGTRTHELLRHLQQLPPSADACALHVFGISHLPPDALDALAQLAQSRDVYLYFPDPCRELWDYLRTRREILREGAEAEHGYLEIGHPLLATLGRMGQQFTLLLNGLPAPSIEDARDAWDQDAATSLASDATLLTRLQTSIRVLDPGVLAAEPSQADASLRVHVCHTRLRELEVLKDALLDFLEKDRTLEPREIVVMAPNIALYAPFLATLFGAPGRGSSALPYHLADVSLARTHPLLHAFGELLQLPQQRVTRSQVLGLLALPAVQRRLRLPPGALDGLERWLERACVAWGLDGPMKAEFGAAPVATNSFAFGLDRMFAGYVLGNDTGEALIDDCVLPAAPIMGPEVEVLGALDRLLQILRGLREGAREPRHAAAWSAWLEQWVASLFVADPTDLAESAALKEIKRLIAKVPADVNSAGNDVDPLLPFAVYSEVLREALSDIPERQPFLAGGITFCGMVPQRAVPFKVVCILGLADGEFPRASADNGLDLMRSRPRLGDRDSRMDDRYLFLEALMSARSALHLSYVGEGVRDGKPRNPAAPLSELQALLDQECGVGPDGERSWLLRHALQPFDARYYTAPGDPRWFSYAQAYAQLSPAANALPIPGFLDGLDSAPTTNHEPRTTNPLLTLEQLERYFKDPARRYCEDVLGLSRRALDDREDPDLEPLEAARERHERRHVQMVWTALEHGQTRIPLEAPASLACSGQIAPGALGVAAYELERAAAQKLLDHARQLPPFRSAGASLSRPQRVELTLPDGTRIEGALDRVFAVDDDLWLVEIAGGKVDFRQLLPLFLRWALLKLTLPPERVCNVVLIHDEGSHAWPQKFPTTTAALSAGLDAVLRIYRDSRERRPPYLPRTSFALAADDGNFTKVAQAWSAQEGGEQHFEPGYNALLFQTLEADLGNPVLQEMYALAAHLKLAITGRLPTAADTSADAAA
jgi:exodeoxyribonuclease V gamma subunit